MSTSEHQQAKSLFLAACQRPPSERAQFLDDAAPNDAIRAEVDRLLQHHVENEENAADTEPLSPGLDVDGDADEAPRFIPGQWLADRFRIRDHIGQGGMGEVWLADDTLVNREVALKFLPAAVSRNPAWMRQLRREVRLASEVTHPSVVRIHDLFEENGELFLSMEYVRGEDLGSLLKKVGRLPNEKAISIARQIVAGLAAAHAKGVLHRDLKPSNILIDTNGNARLTDFGLAAARENVPPDQVRSGTPAYMAPEQAAGREVSERSDLYALGLVLYELFTGKPAFTANSIAEYKRLHDSSHPDRPSAITPEIEPSVERIILRCLEKNPADRPASALAVLAALPGGEVLADLLATGQTPPPDIVAMSRRAGGLSPQRAVVLLAAFAGLLVGAIAISDMFKHVFHRKPVMAPSVLEHLAKEKLEAADLSKGMHYAAYGFTDAQAALEAAVGNGDCGYAFSSLEPDDTVFWYRGSLTPLVATRAQLRLFKGGGATLSDPPVDEPGMCVALCTGAGKLVALMRVPTSAISNAEDQTPMGIDALAPVLGITVQNPRPATPVLVPRVTHSERLAWTVDTADGPRLVEAAFLNGITIFAGVFETADTKSTVKADMTTNRFGPRVVALVQMLLPMVLFAPTAIFVRKHLNEGRSDPRGAFRLAAAVCAAAGVVWLLLAPHDANLFAELESLAVATIGLLAVGTMVWCFYVALEPYVRSTWPQSMISWSRLLLGHFGEPSIGRDLLIGATLGAGWALLLYADPLITRALGLTPHIIEREPDADLVLLGGRHMLGVLFFVTIRAVYRTLLFAFSIVVLRIIVRPKWLAYLTGVVVIALFYVPLGSHPAVSWATIGVGGVAVAIWALAQFGLIAVAIGMTVSFALVRSPISFSLDTWNGQVGLGAVGFAVAVALTGFILSIRKPRPAYRSMS